LSEYYWPIRAIAIAPSNPDIIYVGTSGLNPYSSLLPSAKGIYKSTNGGSEWTSVGGPYTGKWIFKTYCSISSLVVDPTDPDTVYAGTVGGGIWKTTNGGESWEKIWDTPVPDKSLDVNALAISPANPNTIYAATYHFPPENLYASGLAWEYDLIKSENGGDTFETVPHPEKGEFIQYKIDDIAVDNKNADIVYVIDERYKVYRSTTGGKNWLEASGVGGNDPLPFIQSVPGLAWFHRYWKSGSIAIPTAYSNVIYASGEWGFKNVYHSHDSGENWLPYGDLKDRHVKELVLASNTDSCVIYATAIEGLFKVDISNSMPSDDNYRLTWVYETDASPNCVSVASDGGYIAVGSPDGLYLLDRDKNLIWAYQTDFPIVDVSMTADVSHIVAGGSEGIIIPDGVVYCLNTQGELLWSTEPNGVSSVSLSPDGNYFAMTYVHGLGWNDIVALWGFNEEKWLWHYTFGRDETGAVSVSADGEYIAVGGAAMLDDGAVRLYNKTGDLLWEYATDTTTLGGDKYSVSISSDGKYIAAGNQRNNNLYFFDRDQKLLWSYNTGYVNGVSISSDGNYIVAASSDKIYLCDRYENLLWTYEINNIKDVSMSADADMIVAVTEDNKVYAFAPAHVLKNIRIGYQPSTHQIVHINATEYKKTHPDEAAEIFAMEIG
jgi:WD40 repeat protein